MQYLQGFMTPSPSAERIANELKLSLESLGEGQEHDTNRLYRVFDKLVLGPREWELLGLQVEDIPPLPKNLCRLLQSEESSRIIEDNRCHRIVLIPAGMTIMKLQQLCNSMLLTLNPVRRIDVRREIPADAIHENPVARSYWVILRNQTDEDRPALQEKLSSKKIYQANLVEVLSFMALHHRKEWINIFRYETVSCSNEFIREDMSYKISVTIGVDGIISLSFNKITEKKPFGESSVRNYGICSKFLVDPVRSASISTDDEYEIL